MGTSDNEVIAIDLGNTASRAFLIRNGQVVDQLIEPNGGVRAIREKYSLTRPKKLDALECETSLEQTTRARYKLELQAYNHRKALAYAGELHSRIDMWLKDRAAKIPVVMCGAVGSREGWYFVGYQDCPADVTNLPLQRIPKNYLGAFEGHDVYIVKGINAMHPSESHFFRYGRRRLEISGSHQSIMRGEETKAAGVYDRLPKPEYRSPAAEGNLICMPGTHSQWVAMCGSIIKTIWTIPAGEMFSILSGEGSSYHEIVRDRSDDKGKRLQSFYSGVRLVRSQPDRFLTSLFSVRASAMTRRDTQASNFDYLSGMLIGREVLEGIDVFGRSRPVTLLVGSDFKAECYRRTFEYLGYTPQQVLDADQMSLEGLRRISERLLGPKAARNKNHQPGKKHRVPLAVCK